MLRFVYVVVVGRSVDSVVHGYRFVDLGAFGDLCFIDFDVGALCGVQFIV